MLAPSSHGGRTVTCYGSGMSKPTQQEIAIVRSFCLWLETRTDIPAMLQRIREGEPLEPILRGIKAAAEAEMEDDGPTTIRATPIGPGAHHELPAGADEKAVHQLIERLLATLRSPGLSALSVATPHGPVQVTKTARDIDVVYRETKITVDLGDWAGLSTALLDVFGAMVELDK